MSLRTSPRPLAAGIVALVATGGLLLGGTPALAASGAPGWSSSTEWSPTTPALKPWPSGGSRGQYEYYNAVLSGETLGPNFSVFSDPEDTFVLTMQTDGDAVLRSDDGRVLFSTGTSGDRNSLIVQEDGNIVVVDADRRPLWSSGTDGEPGAHLVLGEDGDLVLYRQNGTPAWSAAAGRIAEPPHHSLDTGSTLFHGHQLTSENGLFRAVMQRDGNLVGYGPAGAIWSTGTRGIGNRFVIQDDGNAVVYGADDSVRWASGTGGEDLTVALDDSGVLKIVDPDGALEWDSQTALPGSVAYAPGVLEIGGLLRSDDSAYRAVMQADGNFVVYGPSGAIWQTRTSGIESALVLAADGVATIETEVGKVTWSSGPASAAVGPFRLVMQTDGNLVEYDGQGRAVWSTR